MAFMPTYFQTYYPAYEHIQRIICSDIRKNAPLTLGPGSLSFVQYIAGNFVRGQFPMDDWIVFSMLLRTLAAAACVWVTRVLASTLGVGYTALCLASLGVIPIRTGPV